MGIYRKRTGQFKESGERLLFGKKDGYLLAPIDICLFEQTPTGQAFIHSRTPRQFIGTEVRGTGNAKIGVIFDYSEPSVLSVNPIVKITPDPLVSISPTLAEFNPIERSQVREGDEVMFTINNGVRIKGKVRNPIPTQLPFIVGDFEAEVYEVEFNQRLIDSVHGARVFYPSTGKILGMLIGTQGTNALVYPADLM
ncbi:MAG: hypothetical protein QNJ63_09300 [Calothrix sp. MO_192.B10]|nr:hypothetical protein [Calothrix sp. MO_192.B10]